MTLEQLLAEGEEKMRAAGVPEADLSAWYLLQSCFGKKDFSFGRSDYFMRKKEEADSSVVNKYFSCVERRIQRVPLEYITGYTEFMGLLFLVDENVLVPRQDTETLVEYISPFCEGKRVLDLCTGSGCIGLSIGVYGKPSHLVLSDVSSGALNVAEENRMRLCRDDTVSFHVETSLVCGDLFGPVEGMFDVIVSNPPYIESEIIPGLMPEVRKYEPMAALDGGTDGLAFYRRITQEAPEYLTGGGRLCFEIGYDQGESVSALMEERGFQDVAVIKDIAGNDRVVCGVWPCV